MCYLELKSQCFQTGHFQTGVPLFPVSEGVGVEPYSTNQPLSAADKLHAAETPGGVKDRVGKWNMLMLMLINGSYNPRNNIKD